MVAKLMVCKGACIFMNVCGGSPEFEDGVFELVDLQWWLQICGFLCVAKLEGLVGVLT